VHRQSRDYTRLTLTSQVNDEFSQLQMPAEIVGPIMSAVAAIDEGLRACNGGASRARPRCIEGRCVESMYEILTAKRQQVLRSANAFAAAYRRQVANREAAAPPANQCLPGFLARRAVDAEADTRRALEILIAAIDEFWFSSDACGESGPARSDQERVIGAQQREVLSEILDEEDEKLRAKLRDCCCGRGSSPPAAASAPAPITKPVETTTDTKTTTTTKSRTLPAKPAAAPRAPESRP
jgi:hypothetical protein